MKKFIKTVLRVASELSREYIMDKEPFSIETNVHESLLRKGFELKIKYFSSTERETSEIDFYMFSDDPTKKIEEKDVQEFEEAEYTSFDQFAADHRKIIKVTFPRSDADWKNAHCMCEQYCNSYMCRHIIAIANKLGILDPPEADYDDEPLFKPKRGNTKKPSKNPLSLDQTFCNHIYFFSK